MSNDKKDLKERVGKLGMYLIDQAKEKIKELNQQILFRKAEIKKQYREEEIKKSKELREEFINKYEQQLNTNLSTTLLSSKEKLLDLKNELIKDFRNSLRGEVSSRIEDQYSNYIQYLLENMKEVENKVDSSQNVNVFFNERDLRHFSQNADEIYNIFGNDVALKESQDIDVGGFKLELIQEDIIYNYSIDKIIDKNHSLLEKKISEQLKDSEIKNIRSEFEEFINNKKQEMEDILIKYDRI